MTINFRRVGRDAPQNAPTNPAQPKPRVWIWVEPATKEQLEEQLFYFVRGLCQEDNANSPQPVVARPEVMHEMLTNPAPDLVKAMRYALSRFLAQLAPDAWQWVEGYNFNPATLGVALGAYLCLVPALSRSEEEIDPVPQFAAALINTIPPARDRRDVLAYHAVLACPATMLPRLRPDRAQLMYALVNRSPITAMYHPHLYTAPPLTELAARILPGWSRSAQPAAPWRNLDDWLRPLIDALYQPPIARYLQRRWLELEETRIACRNIGLFLEALRAQGDHYEFVLNFYKTFAFLRCQTTRDGLDVFHRWPMFDDTERLLRVEGDSEAAVRLNRRGNERFALMLALLEMINEERGNSPFGVEARLDTLVGVVIALSEWATLGTQQSPGLGTIEFGDD